MTDDTAPWLALIHKILQYIPLLGIAASILVIVMLIALGKWQLMQYALVLLIPLMLVSIWFYTKKSSIKGDLSTLESYCTLDLSQRPFIKIYTIILAVMIIWLTISSSRDALFLALLVLMYGISVIQIFLKKFNEKPIIIQLMITSLIFVLTKQFCYYYFAGGGDCLVHSVMAFSIVDNGYINVELFGGYANYALMHVSIAFTSILTTLPINYAHWIAISIPLLLGSVFIYYISFYLTSSKRISILSVFLYLMIPIVLYYIPNAAPRTLATLAFVILLYIFLKNADNYLIPIWITCGIMTIYMVMVHHAQLILLFAVMTMLIITYYFYFHNFSRVQKGILIIFYSIPILYYLFTYIISLVGILKKNFFGVLTSTDITDTAEVTSTTFGIAQILTLSVGVLLLIIIILGMYYLMLPQNLRTKSVILWPITLLLFAVFIPGVADAFTMISMMEQIGRLQIVLAPIFAVVMAIGCLVLGFFIFNKFQSSKAVAIIMIVFCILMIIASPIISNSRDSDLFLGTELGSSKTYFTESEISMFGYVEKNVLSGSGIHSDYATTRYFTASQKMQSIGTPYYTFPAGTLELFTDDSTVLNQNSYLIFREDEYLTRGFLITLYGGNNVGKDVKSLTYDENDYVRILKNMYPLSAIYSMGNAAIFY